MYPYMTMFDGTEVVHSQIIEEDGKEKVLVHFERATEEGFDSARCELPDYKWLFHKGYTDAEMKFWDEYVHANAHLIFKYASEGGMKIA